MCGVIGAFWSGWRWKSRLTFHQWRFRLELVDRRRSNTSEGFGFFLHRVEKALILKKTDGARNLGHMVVVVLENSVFP